MEINKQTDLKSTEEKQKSLQALSEKFSAAVSELGGKLELTSMVRGEPFNDFAIHANNRNLIECLVYPEKDNSYKVLFYGFMKSDTKKEITKVLESTGLKFSIMGTFLHRGGF